MKATFLLFHAECMNDNRDSVCHLILTPVLDNVRQASIEFIVNPESTFDFVVSNITENCINSAPRVAEEWPKIQSIINQYEYTICSSDGYSARALYATLKRLNIDFDEFQYSNAKTIYRKVFDEFSYSFDYLNYKNFDDCILESEPINISERWADLAIMALEKSSTDSINSFVKENRIRMGLISKTDFIPSKVIKIRSEQKFDAADVKVNPREDNPFFGVNVVFTGKLETMQRNQARGMVVAIGGLAPETLTKETNFLVVGNQDLKIVGESGLSGKMKKAASYKEKGLDIEIITEKDFLEMIKL